MDTCIGTGTNEIIFKTNKIYENCEIAVQKIAISNDRFSVTEFTGHIYFVAYIRNYDTQAEDPTVYDYSINIPKDVSLQILCDLINTAVSVPANVDGSISASIVGNSLVINVISLRGRGIVPLEYYSAVFISTDLASFIPSVTRSLLETVNGNRCYRLAITNIFYGYNGTAPIDVFPPTTIVTWSILPISIAPVAGSLFNFDKTIVQQTAVSDPISTFLIEPMIGATITAPIIQPNSPLIMTVLPPTNNQWLVHEFVNLQWVRVSQLPQNFSINFFHISEQSSTQVLTPLQKKSKSRISLLIR